MVLVAGSINSMECSRKASKVCSIPSSLSLGHGRSVSDGAGTLAETLPRYAAFVNLLLLG